MSISRQLNSSLSNREASYLLQQYLDRNCAISFDPPCSIHSSQSQHPLTILELGSGTGYTGLNLFRQLGQDDLVILSDLPEAVPLMVQGLERWKDLSSTVDGAEVWVRALAWGQCQERSLGEEIGERRLTHVVASDVIYFPGGFLCSC